MNISREFLDWLAISLNNRMMEAELRRVKFFFEKHFPIDDSLNHLTFNRSCVALTLTFSPKSVADNLTEIWRPFSKNHIFRMIATCDHRTNHQLQTNNIGVLQIEQLAVLTIQRSHSERR